jgi:type I restriction-modification system DNA methylase subunit
MAIKKSELYSSLWRGCDELRGGMDASQYKDYVLVLLFVKYVSDKYAGQKNAMLDIPEGASFSDLVALKGDVSSRLKVHQIIIEKYPTLKYTSTYYAEILDTWKGAGEIDQVDTETGYSADVLTGWQVPAGH